MALSSQINDGTLLNRNEKIPPRRDIPFSDVNQRIRKLSYRLRKNDFVTSEVFLFCTTESSWKLPPLSALCPKRYALAYDEVAAAESISGRKAFLRYTRIWVNHCTVR